MSEEENKVEEVIETVEVPEVPAAPAAPVAAHGHGIKDTMEMIKALDTLADFAGRVMADGQINGADLLAAVDLFQKFDVFSDAFMGVKNIDDEIKDLDEAELVQLGTASYKLVKKIYDAVKKK
jgi:hypothetical protein